MISDYCEEMRYIVAIEEFSKRMKLKNIVMPIISFPSCMKVQPLLPSMGAACRFRLNGYSVYLDVFDNLGSVNGPYWEIYDGEECHRFLMNDWQEMLDFVMTLPVREK
jgi:hypothetical protein